MDLRFKANKKQKLAFKYLFDDITTEIGYGWWAWWWKSYVWVSWVWMMCNKYPWTRYSFWRKELKRLKQTTLASYFKFLSDYNIPKAQEGIFNSQDSVIKFMNGSEILLLDLSYMPSDPLYTRLWSLELTGAFIDESAEIDEKAITILSTRVWRHNNEKYWLIPKILEWFNPDKWHVFRRFYMPYVKESLPEYRKFIPALATDNEFIPKSYIEQLEKTDEVTKQRLLYWNFMYDDTPWRLFMYDKILEMQTNNPFYWEKFISCDPAREWRDSTIIILWNWYVIQRVIQEEKSNMKDLKDRIYRLARENWVKKSCIIVDENWLWWWLVDELECQGFINNARQIEPKITTSQTKQLRLPNFEHLKTQCYYILSQLVNSNKIRYEWDPDLFSKLVEELDIVVQIDIDKDWKYRIMKKEDIKERLWRSPDIADCVMMRMFYDIRKPIDLSGVNSNEYPLNINPYEVKIEPITFEIIDSAY